MYVGGFLSTLHSTMYLFLPSSTPVPKNPSWPLHSTMYLFLHWVLPWRKRRWTLYIPQCIYFYPLRHVHHQHPAGLYIPQCIYFYISPFTSQRANNCFTFHNVSISTPGRISDCSKSSSLHSTMYLFLLDNRVTLTKVYVFTFHNVSISTMTPTE